MKKEKWKQLDVKGKGSEAKLPAFQASLLFVATSYKMYILDENYI